MRIIIVGAGEVGTHLAKLLSHEKMDISLLDEDADKLKDLDANYDLLTKIGSPTSLRDLKEIGVKDVDLFIAVTPYESVNMTSCMLAHNLGAKKTLARIDNYEYLLPKSKEFFKKMGIDHLIYPEVLAAQEIAESLQTSWMRNHLSFCGGGLDLLAIKIRDNAIMVNRKFNSGDFSHGRFRVVAIKRKNKTIIPKGTDEIKPDDLVYFVITNENKEENMEFLRKQAAKKHYEVKDIMFFGGSHIAQKTVQRLSSGFHIKILEQDRERSYAICEKLDNALIINADGRNMDILKQEGISEMDAFVAVSGNSESNILACLAAKRFGVYKTIAQVENIDYIPFAEGLDIGTVINKKLIAASYIYQLTLDADVLNVRSLASADAEVVEFVATPGSKITRSHIKDLRLPDDVNIGGLVRAGVGLLVNGETLIMPGDHVIVFCVASTIRKVEKFFN